MAMRFGRRSLARFANVRKAVACRPIRIERRDEAAFRAQGYVDDENLAVTALDAGTGIVLATSGEGTLPGYVRREKLARDKRLGLGSSAFGQPLVWGRANGTYIPLDTRR